jgi:hypothetical protein
MAALLEHAPRRRVWRLSVGLTGLLLVATVGFCWWWFILKPGFDDRRPLVGTWRLESPSPMYAARPELVAEMDLLLDGTIIERIWNLQTDAIEYEQPSPARWRLSNRRYQEIIVLNPLLGLLGTSGGTQMIRDLPLIWEGPDRFRLEPASASGKTLTWSRRDRTAH